MASRQRLAQSAKRAPLAVPYDDATYRNRDDSNQPWLGSTPLFTEEEIENFHTTTSLPSFGVYEISRSRADENACDMRVQDFDSTPPASALHQPYTHAPPQHVLQESTISLPLAEPVLPSNGVPPSPSYSATMQRTQIMSSSPPQYRPLLSSLSSSPPQSRPLLSSLSSSSTSSSSSPPQSRPLLSSSSSSSLSSSSTSSLSSPSSSLSSSSSSLSSSSSSLASPRSRPPLRPQSHASSSEDDTKNRAQYLNVNDEPTQILQGVYSSSYVGVFPRDVLLRALRDYHVHFTNLGYTSTLTPIQWIRVRDFLPEAYRHDASKRRRLSNLWQNICRCYYGKRGRFQETNIRNMIQKISPTIDLVQMAHVREPEFVLNANPLPHIVTKRTSEPAAKKLHDDILITTMSNYLHSQGLTACPFDLKEHWPRIHALLPKPFCDCSLKTTRKWLQWGRLFSAYHGNSEPFLRKKIMAILESTPLPMNPFKSEHEVNDCGDVSPSSTKKRSASEAQLEIALPKPKRACTAPNKNFHNLENHDDASVNTMHSDDLD